MDIKFTVNSSKLYTIENFAQDFSDEAYDKIFNANNLPSNFSSTKSSIEAILVASTCNNCVASPTTTKSNNIISQSTTINPLTDVVRLPTNVIPINYTLTLRAFFQPVGNQSDDSAATNYYTGQVVIYFKQKNPSKSIIFHSASKLKLNSIKLFKDLSLNNQISFNQSLISYLDYQLVKINLDNEISDGFYSLVIDYSSDYGPISNLVGFYRTKYTENGQV